MKNFALKGLLLILFLFILGCTHKCSTEPEFNETWNRYLFDNTVNNFITNGMAYNNSFICTNYSGAVKFIDFNSQPTVKTINGISTSYDNKPIISDKFVIMLCDNASNSLYISRVDDNSVFNTFFSPDLYFNELSNSSFTLLNRFIELGTVNSQNRFFTTIDADLDNERKHFVVYLDLTTDNPNSDLIESGGYFEIPFTNNNSGVTIRDIFSFNEKVYLSYTINNGSDCYLEILQDNQIIEHLNPFSGGIYIVTFFEYQGILWAQKSNTQLAYSVDGASWTDVANLDPYFFNIQEIEQFIFFYYQDEIYCIEGNTVDLKLYQIPTENLFGSTITSICKFNEDIVITTNNGIYYMPIATIVNDKVLIRRQL